MPTELSTGGVILTADECAVVVEALHLAVVLDLEAEAKTNVARGGPAAPAPRAAEGDGARSVGARAVRSAVPETDRALTKWRNFRGLRGADGI